MRRLFLGIAFGAITLCCFSCQKGSIEDTIINYADEVKNRVTITETKVDEFTLKLVINSTLPDVLGQETAKYGIQVFELCSTCKKHHWCNEYYFKNSNAETTQISIDNLYYDLSESFAMSYRVITNIKKKLAAGATLSQGESNLYNSAIKACRDYLRDFHYNIFVEIDGERFGVTGDIHDIH